MKLEDLARFDIKLLVAFQILLEEQHVTRAAERMCVTQSAMSKMMARLTDTFGEELFYRTPHGIQPTERALSLRGNLHDTLEQLKTLVSPPTFDPTTCDRTFRISIMDHLAVRLCPNLLSKLSQCAPNVKVHLVPWSKNSLNDLAIGQLDLALNLVDIDRANYYEHKLSDITPCAIVRKDHPLADKKQISLDEYLSYSFVKVVIPEFNDTHQKDRAILDKLGRQRHIVFETHNINSAFLSLLATDYIMLGGKGLSEEIFHQLGLKTLMLPEELATPAFSYKVIWHQRQHHPIEQRWFREQLLSCL